MSARKLTPRYRVQLDRKTNVFVAAPNIVARDLREWSSLRVVAYADTLREAQESARKANAEIPKETRG